MVPLNQLFLKDKVLLHTADISNSSYHQWQAYGFPIPFLPNLNASEAESTVTTGAIDDVPCPSTPATCPSTPATQDKRKTPMDTVPLVVIDLVEEDRGVTGTQRPLIENQRGLCFSSPMAASAAVPSEQQASQEHEALPHETSTLQPIAAEEDEHGGNHGIDLNETPQQKPKRKKHRPKVIREGRPSTTPKPKTPKPVTPKPAGLNTDKPNGKRKYVRKAKLRDVNTPSPAVTEVVEPIARGGTKSVRRSLNFDTECGDTSDKSPGSTSMFQLNAECQTQGVCVTGTMISPSTKSNVQLTQGPEVVMDTQATISFDLNLSADPMLNEYASFSQKPGQNHQPSIRKMAGMNQVRNAYNGRPGLQAPHTEYHRRELIRENLNNLATHNHSMEVFQNVDGSVTDPLVTGSKRSHNLVDDVRASTLLKIVNAYNDIRHVSHIGEICKKRRTKEQVEFASDSSSVTSSSLTCDPAKSWDTHQMEQNRFTSADAQRLMSQRNLQTTEAMMSFRQTDSMTTNSYPESFRAQYIMSMNDAVNRSQISVSGNLPSRADDREENGAYGIPACLEPIISGSQEKKEPMVHSKKGQTQIVNSIPADADVISVQENGVSSGLRSQAVYKSFQATPAEAKRSNKKTSDLHIQNCQSVSSVQESLNTGFSSQPMPSFEVLIEDIIRKLQYLEINKGYEDATAEAQNALVVYDGGVNKMVPHEGQLILVKKRRPRVKVDLDPETQRMWKLLMGKESTEGNDATDKNKEKWWEEERRVFHGRAESFIARMHLVQGDRRFSQWKGSVVDSVVGVFLTQNVSDHLSSSAFMALAAKFPLRPRGNSKEVDTDKMNKSAFMQDESSVFSCDATEWNRKMPGQEFAGGGANSVYESQDSIGKEIKDSRPIQCDSIGSRFDYFEGTDTKFSSGDLEISNGSLYRRNYMSLNSWTNILGTVTGGSSYVETEDRRFLEDIISSQSSVVSSQNSSEYPLQTAYQVGLTLEASTEAVLIMENMFNAMDNSTSFTKLLEMADGRILSTSSEIDQLTPERLTPHLGCLDYYDRAFSSSSFCSVQQDFLGQPYVPSTSEHVHPSLKPTLVESQCAVAIQERSISNLPPSVLSSTDNINTTVGTCGSSTENTNENTDQQKWSLCLNTNPVIDLHALMSRTETCKETHFLHNDSISRGERTGASLCKNIFHLPLQSPYEHMKVQQNERKSYSERESTPDVVEVQAPTPSCKIYQMLPKSNENLAETAQVVEPITGQKDEVYNAVKVDDEKDGNAPKGKKVRVETEKKSGVEWDSLRRQACGNGTRKERSNDTMDSVDWDAVRQAEVKEISETIRERGMNNMLAERIKEFLNRLVTEHGSIDLEWLRDVPPDKVKDYLLSIRGLGLKSVECVRLLTLHHVAFPVDTNVGRICVRLGWVPLQPLPESLQLHLLELYPVLETIQKYLWPRLCTLDQRTLYELHYQMITFGKVFCTKSKPNCNACPMRGECKHFASAFASARLALPGPEEKSLVSSTISTTSASCSNGNPHLVPLAQLVERSTTQEGEVRNICEPIIEEPTSPEPGCAETSESAIEDAFFEDPDEIPTIKLNLDMFTQNLQNYMQANNMEIQDGDMSKALVLLSSAAASIPMPKLKNVSRLRTEHLVYELPDSHPLLEGLDQRESDDPCPYLLAIWAPGETAQSTEPPNISCNSQETGRLCDQQTCYTCNSKREAETQIVRGTLLIPCRTAMRGSFPLNGTYFQVNEVFADHDSSHKPIDVPREWIWNLPRRTVYFGTSIPTIFKGLSTEGIQHCFWRGFVCVRGFDRTTRAPKPLYARLHFPASKAIRNKSTATNHKE